MPHKLTEPLSEEELQRWENCDPADMFTGEDVHRLIATIRHLQATLEGVVDIVLKEAEHD